MLQLWVRVWIVTLSLYKTVISYKMMLNYSIKNKIKLYFEKPFFGIILESVFSKEITIKLM